MSNFLGPKQTVIHVWDTTVIPPVLRDANCQPGIDYCARRYQFPIADWTLNFLPSSPSSSSGMSQSMSFIHSDTSMSESPASTPVNISNGAHVEQSRSVFVKNLNIKTTESDIRQLMTSEVAEPMAINYIQNGKKTHAIVEFRESLQAEAAINKLQNFVLKGWPMIIRHDKSQDFAHNKAPQSHQKSRQGAASSSGPPIAHGTLWFGET
ncbi:MAG: hypothetical protein Q9162_000110 [Coniocarpon cinnabarinum]